MKRFTAAIIQYSVKPGNLNANAIQFEKFARKARKNFHADIIVGPETCLTGFISAATKDEILPLTLHARHSLCRHFSTLAKEINAHLVVPAYENVRGTIYNTVFFFDRKGKLREERYRKTHLFPSERIENGGVCTPGNKAVVIDTDIAKFGIIICYDGDFPELSRVTTIKGAEVILRPSALLRPYEIWLLTNRARAYDNHVYVIGANSVGPDYNGFNHFGQSMIIHPNAHVIAQARGTDDIIAAELEPEPIRYISIGSKTPMLFDHLHDRNIPAYGNYLHKKARANFPNSPGHKRKRK